MLPWRAGIPAEIASFGAQTCPQSWVFPGNWLMSWHLCGKTTQKLGRGLFPQAILWKRSQRRSWKRSCKFCGEHFQDGQHYQQSSKTLPKVVDLHNLFLISSPQTPQNLLPTPSCLYQVVQLGVITEEGFVLLLLLVNKVLDVDVEAGRGDALGALRCLLTLLKEQRQQWEERVPADDKGDPLEHPPV